MATSVKSKAELEQVALAMMMMAGGEGTSNTSPATEEVGVKTRVTRSSSGRNSTSTPPSLNLRRRSQTQQQKEKQEPVSRICLNKNKNRKNHDQPQRQPRLPVSPKKEMVEHVAAPLPVDDDDDNDGYPNGVELDQSHPDESAIEPVHYKGTNMVNMEEIPPEEDEELFCALNPMVMIHASSDHDDAEETPHSPTESQESANSGSGGIAQNGNGGVEQPNTTDCIYMPSARRIFRPEFKQKVLDAFQNDPDCVGNQRATARKFGIHRRQVQKWLQQLQTGDLVFKDSQKLDQHQEEIEDVYSDPIELTSNKRVPTRSGKASTRRSAANRLSQQNQNHSGGKSSDPPSRPFRASARNRGKSMPLKGGSNKSHFVPTIVHPSSPKTLNLSKAAVKQNGGSNPSSTVTYNYYSDTNGNGTSTNGSMFMNMSTLLASAAAAGNLGMPLSLDNPRNFSPRDHSPINNNGRGSPAYSAGGSSGSGNSGLQNALMLVDELNFLYPHSDFSLLRKALLKEEVSLEKLAHPSIRSKFAEFRVNRNGMNNDVSQGLRDLRRAAAVSPLPQKSASTQQDYNTQQTLDIIRQQQEYLKLLQQCGIGNSSGDMSSLNLTDISNNGGRLPTWFNPFAAAAAAGLPIPSSAAGNGKFNGSDNGNGRRKENSDNHRFASPRVPPAVNSGKAKTVAAALAATRVQSSPQQVRNFSMNQMDRNNRQSQNQRQAGQRRKPKGRPPQRNQPQTDDDIDPTSMLEVVTNIPSPSNSPRTNKNQYSYSSHQVRNNGSSNNPDYNQHGMDLTTTSTSSSTTTTSTTTRLISKAMNKEYSFLNVLGLVRKNTEENDSTTPTSNGYGITHTASLENFVQNILPSSTEREKSPPNNRTASSTSSSSPPASDLNDSDKTKNMVIEAFTYDPEISGDTRAVARKFGLNVRVVMKWLKEAPVKAPPQSVEEYHENGTIDNNNLPSRINGGGTGVDEEEMEYLQTQNLHKVMLNESNNNSPGSGGTTGVNKRKNSKPNQICDFPTDDDAGLNGALDMVVPIKKRRVSSPSPTAHDA